MTTETRSMTTAELNKGLSYAAELLAMRDLLPRDLVIKLDTCRADLKAEEEDRALIDLQSRRALAADAGGLMPPDGPG